MSDQPTQTEIQQPAPEAGKEPQSSRINWDEVPEAFQFLKEELTSARNEAARYRTERNDLREKLTSAASPEELEELKKANEALVRKQLIDEVARKHNVPEDMLDFLTAADADGLEAQAAKLGRPAPEPKEDPVVITELPPSGGSNPLGDPNPPADGKSEYQRWKENGGLSR